MYPTIENLSLGPAQSISRLGEFLAFSMDKLNRNLKVINQRSAKVTIQLIDEEDEYIVDIIDSNAKEIIIDLEKWPTGSCYLNISSDKEAYSKKNQICLVSSTQLITNFCSSFVIFIINCIIEQFFEITGCIIVKFLFITCCRG